MPQLQFNDSKLINDIIVALNREMDSVAMTLIEFMVGELGSMSINKNNPGMEEWKANVIEAIKFRSVAVSGQVVKEIGILDQGNPGLMDEALSLEYGTGSKMLTSENPWYNEFLSSEYYHTSRQGLFIYTLPGESVYDPVSNTWAESKATNRTTMDFMSQTGSKYWTNIFGNSAIMAETYFNAGIDRAIASIDFGDYLMMVGD
jgi:hypothetical protein